MEGGGGKPRWVGSSRVSQAGRQVEVRQVSCQSLVWKQRVKV